MSGAGRTGLTLVVILAAGVGGLWVRQPVVALPDLPLLRSIVSIEGVAAAIAPATRAGSGPIICYRDPDGRPAYSMTPRKTSDGRDFLAVHASEDVSFEPGKKAPSKSEEAKPTADGRENPLLPQPHGSARHLQGAEEGLDGHALHSRLRG